MVAIIDYKAGNLTSVKYAFAALGVECAVTSSPEVIAKAAQVVFPGVGAAASAIRSIDELGLRRSILDAAQNKPFLGICLGMQILFEHSEEDGGVDTLGIFPGIVRRFPSGTGDKVPQMGWNQVVDDAGGVKEYYFVHGYYAPIVEWTVGRTSHAGVEFTSMVKRGNILACQFHPEKSGRVGLALLKDWLEGV